MALQRRRTRLSLAEYGGWRDVSAELVEQCGMSREGAMRLLAVSAGRVRNLLRATDSAPLQAEGLRVRARDFAGLLSLSPHVELEVAPKFLGGETLASSWREDFLFISALAKHGHLLPGHPIGAKRQAYVDIPFLLGKALGDEYWKNSRRPLKSYRHATTFDFEIQGELDDEALALPSSEGWAQTVTDYGRGNEFNATIQLAMRQLVPRIRNENTVARLRVAAQQLGEQSKATGRRRALPPRHRRWTPAYNLASDILTGEGSAFEAEGAYHLPGYLVSTWQAWEVLIARSLKSALPDSIVRYQNGLQLGIRTSGEKNSKFKVWPDVMVEDLPARERPLVVDAKYKGRVEDGLTTMARSDVFECLSFAEAAQSPGVLVVYPHVPKEGEPPDLGKVRVFDQVDTGSKRVVGVEVDVRGIAGRGKFSVFSRSLAVRLSAIADELHL
ncbi:MAG: McrC family protein [Burkholderiales bacterium]|nr:McrC family protein [Burkholderiales bacterium]